MMRRLAYLTFAALALCLTGCRGQKVTEIVVSVASDLSVPTELEVVSFEVAYFGGGGPDETVIDHRWDVDPSRPDSVPLPLTIGLLPGEDPGQPILITVLGLAKEQQQVRRQARLPFAKDRILLLKMNLLRSCLYYDDCGEGQTCGENGCEPIDKDPAQLPDYEEELALQPLEASAPRLDAGAERGPQDLVSEAPSDLWTPDQVAPDLAADAPRSCVHPAVFKDCAGGWCVIPAGCFWSGASPAESCVDFTDVNFDEFYHPVALSRSFVIAQTEVTQQQFRDQLGYERSCHGATPSADCPEFFPLPADSCNSPGCPVEWVTWHEAAAYCNALSAEAGLDPCYSCSGNGPQVSCTVEAAYSVGASYYGCPGYRLPTDAEWEYAARAGTTTDLYSGVITQCAGRDPNADLIAWYRESSGVVPHEVGGLAQNDWGLLDMSGNVWEWVYDGYLAQLGVVTADDPVLHSGAERTRRGGSFNALPMLLRSANRGYRAATSPGWDLGFRCVRTLP